MDANHLRKKAEYCRKLAGLTGRPSRASELLRLAQEFEDEAHRAERRAAAGNKPGGTAPRRPVPPRDRNA